MGMDVSYTCDFPIVINIILVTKPQSSCAYKLDPSLIKDFALFNMLLNTSYSIY